MFLADSRQPTADSQWLIANRQLKKGYHLKKLGYFGALSLVVGNIIGVGIFTTTGYMANYIQSPAWMILAWLVGAIYALSGAMVYSVLASRYPLSGGDYQYLSKAIHPVTGYLFGWSAFFVTYSGSIAALSIAAAFYLSGIFGDSVFEKSLLLFSIFNFPISISVNKLIAILLIICFSWINYRGILLSGTSQIILTAGIFILLIIFSLAGTFSVNADYSLLFTGSGVSQDFSGFLISLIAVLFAYMGWTTAVYVAEEVNEPRSNLPKALISGVLIVGFIYLWVNIVYLIAVPISSMKDVVNIGSKTAVSLWGEPAKVILSGIVLVAVLGSLNSTILSGPRIYMAMGRDGFFSGRPAKQHAKFNAPYIAIIWQAIWSILLVVSGSFNELLSFVVFVAIIFSVGAGVISLKITLEEASYISLNKVASLFYLIFCLLILINTLVQKPVESISGLVLVLVALPFYYFESKKYNKK